MHERREVTFSGHVQGVGFRYTAQSIAERYDVTGYVKNLLDGRVELVVEGRPAELDRYLDDIAGRMRGHIRKTFTQKGPASGDFAGFEIRR